MARLSLAEIRAREDELQKCVNCGLCQAVCPTYIVDGHEGKTARGKITLMRGMLEGMIKPSVSIADLADDCLTCYACQSVCPAGVKTERLWTALREDLAPLATSAKWKGRALRWTVGRPRIFRALVKRHGRREGFDRNRPGEARLTRYGLPLFKGAPYLETLPEEYEAARKPQGRVGLLIGCSGNLSAPWAVDAAITLLRSSGWTVVIPKKQGCCGAPAINNGQWKLAKRLARANIALFSGCRVDFVTSPDATCSAAMGHDYPNLLTVDEVELAEAKELASKSVELSALLGRALDDGRLKFHPLKVTVTIHDSCHSTHLGGGSRWRDLLRAIPGLEIREMKDSVQCCGFGGSYAVTHRHSSDRIAWRKMENVLETGAELVLVGSPGCQIRLQTMEQPEKPFPQVRLAAELIAGMAV